MIWNQFNIQQKSCIHAYFPLKLITRFSFLYSNEAFENISRRRVRKWFATVANVPRPEVTLAESNRTGFTEIQSKYHNDLDQQTITNIITNIKNWKTKKKSNIKHPSVNKYIFDSSQFSLQDNGSAKYFQGAMHTPNMGEKVAQVSDFQLPSRECKIWNEKKKNRFCHTRLCYLSNVDSYAFQERNFIEVVSNFSRRSSIRANLFGFFASMSNK